MFRTRNLGFFLMLVTLGLAQAFAGAAQASEILVERATGPGVSEADLDTATELVKSAVPEVSSDTVTEESSKADFTLWPKLLRLGQSYLMTVARIEKGEVVFSSSLKALSMDELDKVAMRLTRAAIDEESAKELPRVGEITNAEATEGTQRRPMRRTTYVGFGPATMSNLNSSGLGFSAQAARCWDFNTVLLKLLGDIEYNSGALFLDAGLGGNVFLTTTDIAPYLTADFGGGVSQVNSGLLQGQAVGGFVVGVGGGITLLRTASTNLDFQFRAAFMLHDNNLGLPVSYSWRLGLMF